MATEYYIQQGTTQKGPYAIQHLEKLDLPEDTLIWRDRIEGWVEAKELTELQPFIRKTKADGAWSKMSSIFTWMIKGIRKSDHTTAK